ncbi:MAG: hypothetical protein H0U62_14950 [Actinobacteria bacterium]|nr:hypothetical protein [Actinomycetota bacterium]
MSAITRRLIDGVGGRPPTTAIEPVTAARLATTMRAGRALAVLGPAVLLAAHFSNALLLHRRITSMDANHVGAPLTWASGVATAAVAVAALLAALMTGPRRSMVALGLATAFLSLDDMISLHEELTRMLALGMGFADAWARLLWPGLYLPLLLVTGVLIPRLVRAGTRETCRDGVIGLGLLVAALAMALLAPSAPEESGLMQTTRGGIEEALELGGWTFIATSALVAMLANVVRQATSRIAR